MSELVTWGGDAMPDGVLIGPPPADARWMTRHRAVEVTERARACWQVARAGAGGTLAALAEARSGNAHLVLDFDSWHDYVEHVVGDLRELRLSGSDQAVAERVALAQSMRDAGLPYRQIRDRLDVSLGTIRNDVGAAAAEGDVIPLHPPIDEPATDPYEGLSCRQVVLMLLDREGARGLTCAELELETGLKHQTLSPTLLRAERAGLVRRDGRGRLTYAVYVRS